MALAVAVAVEAESGETLLAVAELARADTQDKYLSTLDKLNKM